MAANIILAWIGVEKSSGRSELRFTHVPLQYLRPWRPTFLELRLVHPLADEASMLFLGESSEDSRADQSSLTFAASTLQQIAQDLHMC